MASNTPSSHGGTTIGGVGESRALCLDSACRSRFALQQAHTHPLVDFDQLTDADAPAVGPYLDMPVNGPTQVEDVAGLELPQVAQGDLRLAGQKYQLHRENAGIQRADLVVVVECGHLRVGILFVHRSGAPVSEFTLDGQAVPLQLPHEKHVVADVDPQPSFHDVALVEQYDIAGFQRLELD